MEVVQAGEVIESALVNIAVAPTPFLGALAVTDASALSRPWLTQAVPRSIGLAAIGAHLSPLSPVEDEALMIDLAPLLQWFDHAYIRALIEEGLLGDDIVQTHIQIQRRFVILRDMQRDFGIVVLARLLLRGLQQARADPLMTPIIEHCERIDIPFIVRRLPFEPVSNGGVEPCLVSTAKAQNQPDHLCVVDSDLGVLIAKAIALLAEVVL
ncbi:MAG TPA: hypothetical protein VF510_18835 [Ktedonobacterales bacterium]